MLFPNELRRKFNQKRSYSEHVDSEKPFRCAFFSCSECLGMNDKKVYERANLKFRMNH